MQKKKTAHNKANETKNANVTARATEKVIVDKKTPEEKKEETEREEVEGKAYIHFVRGCAGAYTNIQA